MINKMIYLPSTNSAFVIFFIVLNFIFKNGSKLITYYLITYMLVIIVVLIAFCSYLKKRNSCKNYFLIKIIKLKLIIKWITYVANNLFSLWI